MTLVFRRVKVIIFPNLIYCLLRISVIVLYVVIVGLVDGCYVVLLPILTASLMGLENSVLAWGFLVGSSSITFTLGPPTAGRSLLKVKVVLGLDF